MKQVDHIKYVTVNDKVETYLRCSHCSITNKKDIYLPIDDFYSALNNISRKNKTYYCKSCINYQNKKYKNSIGIRGPQIPYPKFEHSVEYHNFVIGISNN